MVPDLPALRGVRRRTQYPEGDNRRDGDRRELTEVLESVFDFWKKTTFGKSDSEDTQKVQDISTYTCLHPV